MLSEQPTDTIFYLVLVGKVGKGERKKFNDPQYKVKLRSSDHYTIQLIGSGSNLVDALR